MPIDTTIIDFAVIGLGAMGAATFYQLAKSGARVVGIDRYSPPHSQGSSHGQARVTRSAVGEGSSYVPLVKRSKEILGDLERTFNQDLMARTGTLIIGSELPGGGIDFIRQSIEIAQKHDVEHCILTSGELADRYPQLIGLTGTDYGYLEPKAGYLRPEAIVSLQISAALQLGAKVLTNAKVEDISQENGFIIIRMNGREIRAKQAVVAVGWWTAEILGSPFDRLLSVSCQRTFSFNSELGARYGTADFPTLMWFRSGMEQECITVFPRTNESTEVGFFVADTENDSESGYDADRFYEQHIRPFFGGMTRNLAASDLCVYTTTVDGGFIIDRHPAYDRVLVLSACSGHGFKHSLAIGEVAAQLLLNKEPSINVGAFNLTRFST